MTSPVRQQLLNQLIEAGKLYESMRFGQLVCFASSIADDSGLGLPQDISDEPMLAALQRHVEKRAKRLGAEIEGLPTPSPLRTELVQALEALTRHYPEWPLGQLISRLAALAHVNVYDIEDEQLLETARSNNPGLQWFHHYVDTLEHKSTICEPREGVAYPCPCCHYLTLRQRGGFENCPVCFWQDDGQDEMDAATVRGGPNGSLSLLQARENYLRIGASDPKRREHVRPPRPEEQPRLAEQPSVARNNQGAGKN